MWRFYFLANQLRIASLLHHLFEFRTLILRECARENNREFASGGAVIATGFCNETTARQRHPLGNRGRDPFIAVTLHASSEFRSLSRLTCL